MPPATAKEILYDNHFTKGMKRDKDKGKRQGKMGEQIEGKIRRRAVVNSVTG